MRSILEEFTAEYIARHELEQTNLFSEIRKYMEEEGIAGFDENEFPLPERHSTGNRPLVRFDAA